MTRVLDCQFTPCRNSLSTQDSRNCSQFTPHPIIRNVEWLFIIGDRGFDEVFLFELAFFYQPFLFFTDALQQYAGWLVVRVLGNEATFDGFLEYGVA